VSGAASADINSAEEIEAQSGGTLVADWSQGITSQGLSGATPGSSRWFAVGVRDEAGRVSAYTPRKIDFPPNVPALPQGESLSKYAIQVSFTPATGAQSYSILHRENQIDAPQSFSCAASPCVLSGLSPGSTRFFRVVAVSAAGAQSAPSAEIQVSTPAVLTRHTVFLTSTQHTGNLGGAAGADAICQTRAEAAGLAGLWKAVLNIANGQSTDERIVIEAPLYDAKPDAPGPQLIAANANDFWTAMSVAPRYTELGVHLPDVEDEGHNTWTGRATSDNCLGFTSESSGDSGEVGSSFALLQNWGTESVFRCGTEACNTARRLMCINQ
jgi:hypothetical protein